MVARVHPGDDDMTALNQPEATFELRAERGPGKGLGPRARCVDDAARRYDLGLAGLAVAQRHLPTARGFAGVDDLGARPHDGAMGACRAQRQHDQAGIVDPAIGIGKATTKLGRQARPPGGLGQIDAPAAPQSRRTENIVEPQAGPYKPTRAQARPPWQNKIERPCDVRRGTQQPGTLGKGLANQAELVIAEVPQPPMHQLA